MSQLVIIGGSQEHNSHNNNNYCNNLLIFKTNHSYLFIVNLLQTSNWDRVHLCDEVAVLNFKGECISIKIPITPISCIEKLHKTTQSRGKAFWLGKADRNKFSNNAKYYAQVKKEDKQMEEFTSPNLLHTRTLHLNYWYITYLVLL